MSDELDLSAAREALEMERTALDRDLTDPAVIVQLFREHSYEAALAITQIAMHGANDRIRLDAAKYVVERAIGRMGETSPDGKDPIDDLVNRIMREGAAA